MSITSALVSVSRRRGAAHPGRTGRTAVFFRAVTRARRAEPVPTHFVREAGPITDEDWEPVVPLR